MRLRRGLGNLKEPTLEKRPRVSLKSRLGERLRNFAAPKQKTLS